MHTIRNFIGGRFEDAASGAWLDVTEPATGMVYARLADSDERDVTAAVEAGEKAFPGWAATPAMERARIMQRIADLVERDLEPLARAESIDTGKPIRLARTVDIPRVAANFRFFASAVLNARSEVYRTEQPQITALNTTLRQPLGVVGLISPWNLPLYLLTWKIAPAIAVGNACVAKPSEITPMTAHMLGTILNEAGLPAGVVNIVHGLGSKAGAALVAHPRVPALSFTGGTATGKAIARIAAPMFKKLSLELGGKNPTVVFDDVDLDRVMPDIVRSAFTNQGQVCLCGSRILVGRRIYDEFLEKFVSAVSAIKIGDPLEDTTEFGSLVSEAHREKVRSYVALARQEGGTLPLEKTVNAESLPARCAKGYFQGPVVVVGLKPTCRTMQEEIFGPVVCLASFESEEEAVSVANGTPYGLSASVWTKDGARAQRVAERLQAGTVWVNCWMVRDLRAPFGGVKQSGVGREGGEEALRFFTEAKNVCVKCSN